MTKNDGYMYRQLTDRLIEQIRSGAFGKSGKLPSEREFCDMYHMSRTTVRKALRELSLRGEIVSRRGKGTFATSKRLTQELNSVSSFTEDMKRIGRVPSQKLLKFGIASAGEKISELFEIRSGSEVWEASFLKLADGVTMISETCYLRRERFPELTGEDIEAGELYETLSRKYALKLEKAEETLEPVRICEPEAGYFAAYEQTIGMRFERIAYESGRPFEFSVRMIPCNIFRYHQTLDYKRPGIL